MTPRGVAAFAGASLRRLFLVQFIVALLAAAAALWFVDYAWVPTITEAIRQLPPSGQIRSGALIWPQTEAQSLAKGRFLAFTIDPRHAGQLRSAADIEIEFGQNDLRIFSLFGYLRRPYPSKWIIAFNRPELEPWWGAWTPPLLGILAISVIAGLFLSWAALATIYSLPAWLLALFANRDLSLSRSWRLAGAALMPGALLLIITIYVYGLGILDLVQFSLGAALHLVLGWIYLVAGTLAGPRVSQTSPRQNPFASSDTGTKQQAPPP